MSSGFSATSLIWFGKGGLKKYINQFLTTGAIPKGSWDAATNTPRLVNGTGTAGWYYDVVEAGSQFGYNFLVGDRVLYADNKWQRVATGVESDNPIVVAYVDENTVAFPTTRPSGMPLKIGDWVEVKSTAIIEPPIVIEGITIDSYSDKVEWNGTAWQLKDYASAKSNEVALNKPLKESISGSAEFQSEANIEFVEAFKKIITFRGYIKTTEPTGEIVTGSFWYQGTMPVSYPIQVKTYDGVQWSATTEAYTPSLFDYVSDLNTNKDYYWLNGKWNILNNDIDYKVVSTFYEVEGNTHTLYILTENVTVGADEYVKGVYEWDSTNGFVLKYAFREHLEVETFVGVEGNEYTLYILTQDITISDVKYRKGFYTWDSENGFVVRSSVVEVDNVTIDKDEDGKLKIKLEGIETKHIKPSALAKSTDNVRDYANSVDTKVATEKFLQKTLLNIETPENNKDAVNKKYVDDEIAKVVATTYTFKGYISTTQPTSAKTGNLWYEGATLPTTFPINVKTYDGTNWSATTSEYTPNDLDLWSLIADKHGYYWFGGEWNILDTSQANPDNITIQRNNQDELEVKNGSITNDKLATDVKVGSLANLSTTAKSNVVESINELYNGKQNKITDSTQSSNPTDTDSLSDLNGTTNKRWTFAIIWNWISSKLNPLLNNKVDKLTSPISTEGNKRIYQCKLNGQGQVTSIETEFNWSNNYVKSAENQLFTRKGANDMYVNYLKSTNGTLTKSSSITNDYSHYVKCGNIYQLSIGFQNNADIAKDALLYTLPETISSASIEMYIVISTISGDTRVLQCGGSYGGNQIKAKSIIPVGYWFGSAIFVKL